MAEFNGVARKARADDFARAAQLARIPLPAMRAVAEVESRNSGFDAKGRPIILFEPHVFWRNLPAGAARDRAVKAGLAYPKWGERPYPRSSDGNYARLAAAIEINREAAFRAVSIGLGQILGENHRAAGFDSAEAMFDAAKESEGAQLLQMAAFIRSNGLSDYLRRLDWASFARHYNGPAYAKNAYDKKLARAYDKWQRILSKPRDEITSKDLAAAGSDTIAGTQMVQGAVKVGTGAVVAAGGTAVSDPSGVVDQISSAADTAKRTADAVEKAKDSASAAADVLHWAQAHWIVIVLALCVVGLLFALWRARSGAIIAERARVDDARSGLNIGRL
jgi:hypothetical protein